MLVKQLQIYCNILVPTHILIKRTSSSVQIQKKHVCVLLKIILQNVNLKSSKVNGNPRWSRTFNLQEMIDDHCTLCTLFFIHDIIEFVSYERLFAVTPVRASSMMSIIQYPNSTSIRRYCCLSKIHVSPKIVFVIKRKKLFDLTILGHKHEEVTLGFFSECAIPSRSKSQKRFPRFAGQVLITWLWFLLESWCTWAIIMVMVTTAFRRHPSNEIDDNN